MKNFLLGLCLFIGFTTTAQSKFETGMTTALDQLKTAHSVEEMVKVSALFERIANAEKNQWLPYYYSALATYYAGWMDEKTDKDVVAEKCKGLLVKAEALEMNNAELFCLQQMIATMQLVKDPMNRWQTFGSVATQALESAKKADPTNPRIYYLQGQSLLNTPEAYGGGKTVAKPLFEKSVELFKSFKPASPFHPTWGQNEAEKSLAACK